MGEWYINKLNPWWKTIIGHTGFYKDVTSTIHFCCCDPIDGSDFGWCELVADANTPCAEGCEGPMSYTSVRVVWEEGESDGILPATSQTGNPNAKDNVKLKDTSHMQARNGEELESELKERTFEDAEWGKEFELTPR